eukprot:TRINITY_DN38347_c0_g1_i1.p1 TRINITY_DN38347_c0_g1~~TRINITY_DN38347_c0_g1_i1.p1  ORF type:complete len:446 (-),score=56.15 TRINITY_DN38347_c0_g1_i1:9-1313(-)
MDRLWKQVHHLLGNPGKVHCSGIEVSSFYSVPDASLSIRTTGLDPLVFENTLCFTRSWWEAGGYGFGESWEVSGQGEGTLEPWWDDVKPLTASQEPFLYIYLPSSASGGSAVNKNRQPPPSEPLFTLFNALLDKRFPSNLSSCAHVTSVLSGAQLELEMLLGDPQLFQLTPESLNLSYDLFRKEYAPVQTQIRRYSLDAGIAESVASEYPEAANSATWAQPKISKQVWSMLRFSSKSLSGRLLSDAPPLRILEGVLDADMTAEIIKSAIYDQTSQSSRRDRADVPSGPAAEHVRTLVGAALGLPSDFIEPMRLVRYSKVGQAFERHVDWIVDPEDPQLSLLGQRIATALIFLNDVDVNAGGATDFPLLGLAVTPRAGTALLWPNVRESGQPLLELVHEAMPMTQSGHEKIALNVWIRDRPLPTDPAILSNLLLS